MAITDVMKHNHSVIDMVHLNELSRVPFWQRQLVYSYFMPVWGIVKTIVPMCRGQLDALLPDAEAVHGTEGK